LEKATHTKSYIQGASLDSYVQANVLEPASGVLALRFEPNGLPTGQLKLILHDAPDGTDGAQHGNASIGQ
jgi:hypothetical protein